MKIIKIALAALLISGMSVTIAPSFAQEAKAVPKVTKADLQKVIKEFSSATGSEEQNALNKLIDMSNKVIAAQKEVVANSGIESPAMKQYETMVNYYNNYMIVNRRGVKAETIKAINSFVELVQN